jgi:nucleoid-associated protein YgaU
VRPPARPTGRTAEPTDAAARRHTVKEGDTLFSLARTYYGDPEHFDLIYQANRGVLREPDPLPVGAELVIPAPPAEDGNP